MAIDKQLIEIAGNMPKVYEAGYEQGKADNDTLGAFWDNYQESGTMTDYRYAFCGFGWNNRTFKPKYSLSNIKFTNCIGMFQYTAITAVNYDLDFSNATSVNFCFTNSSIKKIQSIVLPKTEGTNSVSTMFNTANKLSSIRIKGETVVSFSLGQSPLDKDSIKSVVNSLSTTTTGKTVAFKKTAVNNAFTTDEWNALTATKPNWNFTLS